MYVFWEATECIIILMVSAWFVMYFQIKISQLIHPTLTCRAKLADDRNLRKRVVVSVNLNFWYI